MNSNTKHFDETTVGKVFVTVGYLTLAAVLGTFAFAMAFTVGGTAGVLCEACGAEKATALNVAWFVCGALAPLLAMPIGFSLSRSLAKVWR